MKTITIDNEINLRVVKFELDFSALYNPRPKPERQYKKIKLPNDNSRQKHINIPPPPKIKNIQQKPEVKDLIEELLNDIYADHQDWSSKSAIGYSQGSTAAPSITSTQSNCGEQTSAIERSYLESLAVHELKEQVAEWKSSLQIAGESLARCLSVRDRLHRKQKKLCAAFTVLLRHISTYYVESIRTSRT